MTRLEDRQTLAAAISAACAAGARLGAICAMADIDVRTFQRWQTGEGLTRGDRRPDAVRPVPPHALSPAERARIITVANEPRFADMPPARIVPALADKGVYLASEASFHRVLRAHGQANRRGRARPPRSSGPPRTHVATGPRQVWCGDVTFLPAQVQGRWFYLYLILDLYSRKVVGFEVHDSDSAEHAAHLAKRTALAEGVLAGPARPVLHGDNGATLKATTVLAMLHWLGIEPSYSRPWRLAAVKPHRRLRTDLQTAVWRAIPVADGDRPPVRAGIRQHLGQAWQALALLARPSFGARLARRCGFIQRGVQTQPGHTDDAMADQRHQQVQNREAAVAEQHDRAPGQPAAGLPGGPAPPPRPPL